ncbi:hypothetical protein BN11_1100003 [Nostocoides australiense Ben110]|uniref:Uncharacterized protein n=1 Tax=Nostocoides australiense Ben110 TaxID=1193182 RepID=W6K0H6_9MICO|nr:hypothetical protein BN11_1100003 [Tetrasphaera australiensis Ben110]
MPALLIHPACHITMQTHHTPENESALS